jgi:hypothetical protein
VEREQRNALHSFVAKARRLLEEELGAQLEGLYSILPGGEILGEAPGDPLVRARLLGLIEHHRSSGTSARVARERAIRELAFTTLNRFAALKMAERRGLIPECVGELREGVGVQMLGNCAPGLKASFEDGGHRLLLESVMDELSLGLRVLFDRRSPVGLLWPRPKVLQALLEMLNAPAIESLWAEDETIGWIYQDFNGDDVRDMRDASAAPRDSRELAVRNQFFTPRYVVQFLVDNTLGRIWYEMRHGKTVLRDRCPLLAYQPGEVFLDPGVNPPEQDEQRGVEGKSETTRPLYITHRAPRDPRDLRILDPAVGSGHFLLYAFDLLDAIYQEGWADSSAPNSEATGRTLREDYPSEAELRRAMPGLILRHNLYGIEIDARAAQIAALALWLRAQRAYQELGLPPTERPVIARSNIVVAEPMPGEKNLLDEFTARLDPAALRDLVGAICEEMRLADETGSLLKIESHIASALQEAARRAGPLFVRGAADFWSQAETRLLEALEGYASEAAAANSGRRRLFAEDTAQGIAFIHVCRERFDVIVMNPPFGDPTSRVRRYIDESYPRTKGDLATAFAERSTDLLQATGLAGMLTTRTWLFGNTFEEWRRALLTDHPLVLMADLGYGVLDAVVETAAITWARGGNGGKCGFVTTLRARDKASALKGVQPHYVDRRALRELPRAVLAYWIPSKILGRYLTMQRVNAEIAECRQGIATADDFRFLRLAWEVPPNSISGQGDRKGATNGWVPLAKGGEYRPYWDDIYLAINWRYGGKEVTAFSGSRVQNTDRYFHPGLTWTYRTTSAFCLKALPAGAIFSVGGWGLFPGDDADRLPLLALYNSALGRYFLEVPLGLGDTSVSGTAARNYGADPICAVPWVRLGSPAARSTILRLIESQRSRDLRDETSRSFSAVVDAAEFESARAAARRNYQSHLVRCGDELDWTHTLEKELESLSGLTEADLNAIHEQEGLHPCNYPRRQPSANAGVFFSRSEEELVAEAAARFEGRRFALKKAYFSDRRLELICHIENSHPRSLIEAARSSDWLPEGTEAQLANQLVSYAVGLAFGRWDVRMALDHSLVSKLADPFDSPPAYPPGMLVGPDGLPARQGSLASEKWLRARPDASHLPPPGSVGAPSIDQGDYPLRIPWDGILVDDPGTAGSTAAERDVVRRIREVLDVVFAARGSDIEAELCQLLAVREVREFLRRPTGFFADHLSRYSRSRRKAPIYWPLSTPSGKYTVWIYYPRLAEDTLYRAITTHVEPKLAQLEQRLAQVSGQQRGAFSREAARLAQEAGELTELRDELREMREELLRVAQLPYKPCLDDGVQITAAPLWRLFRHRPWRKTLEDTWKELERGDYDWAHLAMAIWPKRVREKCRSDRSLAIAHGVEGVSAGDVAPLELRGSRCKKRQRKK